MLMGIASVYTWMHVLPRTGTVSPIRSLGTVIPFSAGIHPRAFTCTPAYSHEQALPCGLEQASVTASVATLTDFCM